MIAEKQGFRHHRRARLRTRPARIGGVFRFRCQVIFAYVAILVLAGYAAAQFPPQAPSTGDRPRNTTAASAPASQPAEFHSGITLDWARRCVRIRATVVLQCGPIEFLACRPGKEHESILLLAADATHIFQALGLSGLTPGNPPTWDDARGQMTAATGDLADVRLEWTADGEEKSADWSEWILETDYSRHPAARPLVFSGSVIRADRTVACEKSGAVMALVDMPDALLAPTRSRSDREADLWALADPGAIPPIGTEVYVVVSAAKPRRTAFRLTRRGEFEIDGRFERLEDAIDLIQIQRRFYSEFPVEIQVLSTLKADIHNVERCLRAARVPADAVRFARSVTATSYPASAPTNPRSKHP